MRIQFVIWDSILDESNRPRERRHWNWISLLFGFALLDSLISHLNVQLRKHKICESIPSKHSTVHTTPIPVSTAVCVAIEPCDGLQLACCDSFVVELLFFFTPSPSLWSSDKCEAIAHMFTTLFASTTVAQSPGQEIVVAGRYLNEKLHLKISWVRMRSRCHKSIAIFGNCKRSTRARQLGLHRSVQFSFKVALSIAPSQPTGWSVHAAWVNWFLFMSSGY